jgi:hypothetical protein
MYSGGGSLAVESAAGLAWNQWQLSRGIGGRLAMESVAGLAWNTHCFSNPAFDADNPDFLPCWTLHIRKYSVVSPKSVNWRH